MTVIGITGPTGSGKTTALEALARMGYEIVDCDALYYELLRTDRNLRQSLEEAFGPVFLPDGSLDRKSLSARVFGDSRELRRLNAIVFPAVYASVEQKIKNCSQKGLAIDAINLVESGLAALCALTVAITADPALRLRRIMARDGLDEKRAMARIAAQKPDSWYRDQCTFVLENRAGSRAEFQRLMENFFAGTDRTEKQGGKTSYGRESMEEKNPRGEKERL